MYLSYSWSAVILISNKINWLQLEVFKCYYEENHIFPIKAIFKHRPVICTRKIMLFTIFKFVPDIFNWWNRCHKLNQILIKLWWRKIPQPICIKQKCLILCRKTLLEVLHNMSLTFLLPWQHSGFQTSLILKAFPVTLNFPYWYIWQWCLICMIQQAYNYIC